MALNSGDGSSSSNTTDIRSSQFFVPTIVRSFVQSVLNDANFPLSQLQWLMQLDDAADEEGQVRRRHERIAALRQSTSASSPLSLNPVQQKALADAIGALCTDLALPANDAHDDDEQLQRRCMLGFCRLLAGQTIDAAAELDVARRRLHAQRQRWQRQTQCAGRDDAQSAPTSSALYVVTLSGAELAAEMLGKTSEATRLWQWRRQAMLHQA